MTVMSTSLLPPHYGHNHVTLTYHGVVVYQNGVTTSCDYVGGSGVLHIVCYTALLNAD